MRGEAKPCRVAVAVGDRQDGIAISSYKGKEYRATQPNSTLIVPKP